MTKAILLQTSNMLAVSNTSPISNLASIGQLHLLKLQFSTLWIPVAVAEELAAHPDPAALIAIQTALRDEWIRIATPEDSTLLNVLSASLHTGEAEAIRLACDLKANVVLIDEQEGRQFARRAGLFVTGVLGVLLRAKRDGEIAAVKPALQMLREKAGFFIAAGLEAQVLLSAGE